MLIMMVMVMGMMAHDEIGFACRNVCKSILLGLFRRERVYLYIHPFGEFSGTFHSCPDHEFYLFYTSVAFFSFALFPGSFFMMYLLGGRDACSERNL